jgi:peptidoglycan/LPS O-acetylase OafA/YrhL
MPNDDTPAEQLRSGRRAPSLDGLRGVACLIVLLHHSVRCHAPSPGAHLFNRVAAAGWAGVDLFFVLSGFLITRLLLDARSRQRGLTRFWTRRALRILPLAYAYLAIVIDSPLSRGEPWHAGVYREQAWFWLYANNWLALFRPALDHGLLGHFWSLAIEEQFYLLWPLAVLFLSPGRLRALCVVAIGMGLLARVCAIALGVDSGILLSLPPTRLDGLLLGAWLALRPMRGEVGAGGRRMPRSWLLGAAVLLSAILVWPARGLPAQHPWVVSVGSPALGAIFALLLSALLSSAPSALLRRACEAPPLVSLGRVSYGFYVLHVPVVATLHSRWSTAGTSLHACVSFYLVAMLGSAACATVTWFALERPFLRLRPDEPRRSRPLGAAG